MTLSLAAVFIPVLFMGGIVGRLLHEFAVTIGVAILVSGFVVDQPDADAVQPLPEAAARRRSTARFYNATERMFDAWLRAVRRTLRWALRSSRAVTMVVLGRAARRHGLPVRARSRRASCRARTRGRSSASPKARRASASGDDGSTSRQVADIVRSDPNVAESALELSVRGGSDQRSATQGIVFAS